MVHYRNQLLTFMMALSRAALRVKSAPNLKAFIAANKLLSSALYVSYVGILFCSKNDSVSIPHNFSKLIGNS